MKIADGGLQSLLMEGNIFPRQIDPARDSTGTPGLPEKAGTACKVDESAILKAVEQLNSTAKKFNQPLHFGLTGKNRTVLVTHIHSGEKMELTPQQALRLNNSNPGVMVDKEI